MRRNPGVRSMKVHGPASSNVFSEALLGHVANHASIRAILVAAQGDTFFRWPLAGEEVNIVASSDGIGRRRVRIASKHKIERTSMKVVMFLYGRFLIDHRRIMSAI